MSLTEIETRKENLIERVNGLTSLSDSLSSQMLFNTLILCLCCLSSSLSSWRDISWLIIKTGVVERRLYNERIVDRKSLIGHSGTYNAAVNVTLMFLFHERRLIKARLLVPLGELLVSMRSTLWRDLYKVQRYNDVAFSFCFFFSIIACALG